MYVKKYTNQKIILIINALYCQLSATNNFPLYEIKAFKTKKSVYSYVLLSKVRYSRIRHQKYR